jgi:hypothetical protein
MRPAIQLEKILLLLIAVLLGLPASAAVESGVEFDEVAVLSTASREPIPLELCSTGLLRYKRILRGYAAALYREECGSSEADLSAAPLRLELSYFWSIDGSRFGEAAEKMLRRSLDPAEFTGIEARMRRLHASYRSVSPGDRYALTWTPGVGTELALNGRALVTIAGEDFARAYFDLWLGEEPMDENLRNALLARSN